MQEVCFPISHLVVVCLKHLAAVSPQKIGCVWLLCIQVHLSSVLCIMFWLFTSADKAEVF